MNEHLTSDMQEIMHTTQYRPFVTIILPFEPKMSLKTELAHSLKLAVDKVEKELATQYAQDTAELVVQKLRHLTEGLNFNTHKKSIAIYVSPLFEKVLYLDIPVEERIIVGDSFEIRDLVYAKKQLHKHLVLVLSFNKCHVYLGDSTTLVKIVSNTANPTNHPHNDIAQRIANFSDKSERKEVLMDKFLHHIDNNLDLVLNAYRLPLFVIGTKRITGHFNKLTKHSSAVVGYIHGNYETATLRELKDLLEPHIGDWMTVRNKEVLNKVEEAFDKNKLAFGTQNVWRAAMQNKGHLLVIEKNFHYPAVHANKEDAINAAAGPGSSLSFINDAVDKIIEKVLETGGDVEFVDSNLLLKYDHIALIEYY